MPRRIAILLFMLVVTSLAATELRPWHGRLYDIDIRGKAALQQFQWIDTHCGKVQRPECDGFYTVSVLGVPEEMVTIEAELSALDSRHRLFGLQAFRLTGRYFWLNDIVDDPVSLATGITVSQIFHAARRNIATFDHGGIACEGHIAIGKEYSCEQFWVSRWWGVLGLGIADVGYPWLRANLAWERNWWERHQVKVFMESIWGFGSHDLVLHPRFSGYGNIQYQAIDAGVRYGFRLDNDALLSLAYAYRVYGRNCPRNVNLLQFEICYPYGL
jgi:hypothetical protein